MIPYPPPEIAALSRKLVFVHGKGGVGKTLISKAIARSLPGRCLWVTFEDPSRPPQSLRRADWSGKSASVDELACEASASFREYIGMKIGAPALAKLFLQNKLVQYLAKAAPGIRELVLLGKVWHERQNYDHVVCDMPSTGHGLAMLQSMGNFSALFGGGPLARDAESMIASFRDPGESVHCIVALPEEMPLVESLELAESLERILPGNPPRFIANRIVPGKLDDAEAARIGRPDDWPTPVAASLEDYLRKRWIRERENLRLWDEAGIQAWGLPFFPTPETAGDPEPVLLRHAVETMT